MVDRRGAKAGGLSLRSERPASRPPYLPPPGHRLGYKLRRIDRSTALTSLVRAPIEM